MTWTVGENDGLSADLAMWKAVKMAFGVSDIIDVFCFRLFVYLCRVFRGDESEGSFDSI